MKKLTRCVLLMFSLVVLPGCGETPQTLVRTVRNRKNELFDRLQKVTDEASAKKFETQIAELRDKTVKKCEDKMQEVCKTITEDDEVVKPKATDKQIKANKKQISELQIELKKQSDPDRKLELQNQVADLEKRTEELEKKLEDYYNSLLGGLANAILADDDRFAREKARLDDLIKQFKDDKVPCPTLQKLAERKTYDGTMLTIPVNPVAPGMDKKLFLELVKAQNKKKKDQQP